MAMNGAILGTMIANALYTALSQWNNPPASEKENPAYSLAKWCELAGPAIGEQVVAHITSAANCSGQDSHGDSHDAVKVV